MARSAEYQDTVQELRLFIDETQLAKESIAVAIDFQGYMAGQEILHFGEPEFLPTYSSILDEIVENDTGGVPVCEPTFARPKSWPSDTESEYKD